MAALNFSERPVLVFWETTKACALSCLHCRAEALAGPLPGELTTREAERFLDSLTAFGKPLPVVILTGGDLLMRPDILHLIGRARGLGLPVGLSPSVTDRLTPQWIDDVRRLGVRSVSVSLDGGRPSTHDDIRGVPGHWGDTLRALRNLTAAGMTAQVNTTVMRENVRELPILAELLIEFKVPVWEVFFLIQTGRGSQMKDLNAQECEDVIHFLYDVSRYGLAVRTVEAPFFRRVVRWRQHDPADSPVEWMAQRYALGGVYTELAREWQARMGAEKSASLAQGSGMRDGNGIVFVGYD